jgi:hypothetical protein
MLEIQVRSVSAVDSQKGVVPVASALGIEQASRLPTTNEKPCIWGAKSRLNRLAQRIQIDQATHHLIPRIPRMGTVTLLKAARANS